MTSWRAPGSILEAPDSIFETPGLDFRESWDECFEILGVLARKLQELISNLPLQLRGSSLEARVARSSYSNLELQPRFPKRVGGGDPPPGVFNGMEPSPPNLGPKTVSYIQKIASFRYLGLIWAKKASHEASGDPK